MANVNITKFFAVSAEKLFSFWTEAKELEKWASPEGVVMKIRQGESKKAGSYIFEHHTDNGVYVFYGYYKEFIPNKKLIMIDMVKDPAGKISYSNLETTVVFEKLGTGTEISIMQKGFDSQSEAQEFQHGWEQALDKLIPLVQVDLIEPGQNWDKEGRAPLS